MTHRCPRSLRGLLLAVGVACAAGLASAHAAGDLRTEAAEPLRIADRTPAAPTAAVGVAVLYPKLEEPFGTVFQQIVTGIEAALHNPVVSIALAGTDAVESIEQVLREHGTRVVIALGRHGLEVATSLADRLPVVGGAVLASPTDGSGADTVVSLTPDPDLLFQRLRVLSPGSRRIFVVHSSSNDWLIEIARRAARAQKLELVATAASDRQSAVKAYRDIMKDARPMDAIWLPQDALVVDRDVVLPFVLQGSWDRSLVLFSSTLGHVQRGALFALYPDNHRMGEHLASSALALDKHSRQEQTQVEPLRELLAAINVRTASHLGLDVDDSLADYALTFPVR
ncbi:MAG: hypothetical protein KDG55_04065 [Rhodocyclaceae bacterium]|nr:hypothetical protein [Rhodocyclaceae bacterium]